MAYSIRCADAGVDCPGSFTTETKEELLKHVELHANARTRQPRPRSGVFHKQQFPRRSRPEEPCGKVAPF